EAGRYGDTRLFPKLVSLLVVSAERLERRLQLWRQAERVKRFSLAATLSWHLRADVLPQIAKHRHLAPRDIVRYRDARQLDDSTLDGVHQREVAHSPGKERSLGITGASQEEGRRREVDHLADAQLA